MLVEVMCYEADNDEIGPMLININNISVVIKNENDAMIETLKGDQYVVDLKSYDVIKKASLPVYEVTTERTLSNPIVTKIW